METRQLEHEGFEHLNEWRIVELQEWYQDSQGKPSKKELYFSDWSNSQHGGKRWILRKKTPVVGNPKKDEAIQQLERHLGYLETTVVDIIVESLNRAQLALQKLKEV